MQRRDFLKAAAATTAALSVSGGPAEGNAARLARRNYGATRVQLSVIGFGGIVVMGMQQERANRTVAEAFERGVNYFDVAPSYGNGEAEEKLGPALEPYRKQCFLACKTMCRDRAGAERELTHSLQVMRTDHFDLYQLHALTDTKQDVDAAFAAGGAMEAILAAKKQGRIRHVGFSAHSTEAAMDRYDFDSILFPCNVASFHKGNFGPTIIEKARSKGVARLALKLLARQKWPKDDPQRGQWRKCWYQPITDPAEAVLAVRFTLSQPVTAAIPPGHEELFKLALEAAMKFKPLDRESEKEVRTLAAKLDPLFEAHA